MLALAGLGVLSAFFTVASTTLSGNAPLVRFPKKSVQIIVRKGKNSEETEKASLRELLETRCPSLFTAFSPAWWLFNGHLQTFYCVLGDFTKIDHVLYRRKYLRLADGGTLGLDFTPASNDASWLRDNTPIIVVKHGLTGGSYEAYIRAILSRACASVEDGGLGYRAVVVNFRGCASVPITSPQLYSAGHTDDLRQALIYISNMYPKAPLLGIGFSLGANVMTRYLAEEGEMSRIRSCCTMSCPWDLARNNKEILSTYFGRHIYSKGMGTNLLNLVKKHCDGLTSDPDHIVAKTVPAALALNNPTLDQFDSTFTRIAGGSSPPYPFATAHDYYAASSSHDVINDIRVPYLSINAADDPVVPYVPMEELENDYLVMELTAGGGHLGWFQSQSGLSVDRWTTKPVLEWLRLSGEDMVHIQVGPRVYTDSEGFLREEGRPHIGCKLFKDGGLIDWTTSQEGILQGL
ncbi:hypothetical protein AMATHDRAFT_135563 [Amanita thiersii Skay4041]|uniref:AB hydrolase-1 domain-containing protein n=1 Tax=Amanita thiersii Skay4041 TaxID=703135 RepID=A0A2A9NTS1_9AGAR|nr:hypothetical protein AMATHDRAFT_135563 [Amanita thiersii Skay4041]